MKSTQLRRWSMFPDPSPVALIAIRSMQREPGRQRWIGLTKRPSGKIVVDDGAKNALVRRGKSLLAAGVVKVEGKFTRGEVISVRDAEGEEIARGLTNYSADEVGQIMGKRSNQLEKILGRAAYGEVVHRDNLVMTG